MRAILVIHTEASATNTRIGDFVAPLDPLTPESPFNPSIYPGKKKLVGLRILIGFRHIQS